MGGGGGGSKSRKQDTITRVTSRKKKDVQKLKPLASKVRERAVTNQLGKKKGGGGGGGV